jgi:hypothetical protein
MIASRKAASWTSFGTNGAGRKVTSRRAQSAPRGLEIPYGGARGHLPRGAVFTAFKQASKGRAKAQSGAASLPARPVDKMGSRAK